ncbi:anti-sigma factor family protein [Pseudochryseolinea flava]|uniref:Zinc-finger domain-containing protein n=1 Tax=Pseudochryseolinea flava TaxID=2059302 RepID=A0A364Y463_9BACT|nr:anti-sigma factor [Pseudochryseolinea flava]RAW00831.1 hypothetical protein DQQ10_11325 [Pseudochryseolinea flava]
MRCENFEEQIWLYDELSVSQRQVVDEHLKHCADCEKIWQARTQLRLTTRDWKGVTPAPENSAQLTHKIMAQIVVPSMNIPWLDAINTTWLRYAMASLSTLFVVAFFYTPPKNLPHQHLQASGVRDVNLNTSAFLKVKIENRKSRQQTFSLLACIENRECVQSIAKKKKYYESR